MNNPLLYKGAAFLLAVCLLGAMMGGCKNAPATPVDITSFRFVHSDGWTVPDEYTLGDDGEGEGHLYLSWHPGYCVEPGQVLMTQSLQDELWALLQRYNVWRWDGFAKSINACDAPGFYLYIQFADGSRIEADGYGKFPDGYAEARDAIAYFFEAACF